jgi:hypothetical protein
MSLLGVSLGVAEGTPQDKKIVIAEDPKPNPDPRPQKHHIGNAKYDDFSAKRSGQSVGKTKVVPPRPNILGGGSSVPGRSIGPGRAGVMHKNVTPSSGAAGPTIRR